MWTFDESLLDDVLVLDEVFDDEVFDDDVLDDEVFDDDVFADEVLGSDMFVEVGCEVMGGVEYEVCVYIGVGGVTSDGGRFRPGRTTQATRIQSMLSRK